MTSATSDIVYEVRAVGTGTEPTIIGDRRDAERRANQLIETYGLRKQQVTITPKAV